MLSTSFKSSDEALRLPPEWLPSNPNLDNYRWIISNKSIERYYLNTLIVSILSTTFAIIFATFGGYSISRFRYRGRTFFSLYLFVSQMFPAIIILIPIFYILKLMGLINTYLGLILLYITISLPFSTWMMKGYFDGVPSDLEDAAMVDGTSRLGSFFRIVLPLSAPGLAAVTIWSFLLAWQEYLYALTIMIDDEMKTLTVGMASIFYIENLAWGKIMAYCTLYTIPLFILFILIQKYLVQGLTRGAVKG